MNWQPIDWIGLIGGIILLIAFWRVNSGFWKSNSLWYELDNVVGSILLIFYAWNKHAYISILLNIVWGVVAFRGLSSLAERRLLRNPDFKRGYNKARRTVKR